MRLLKRGVPIKGTQHLKETAVPNKHLNTNSINVTDLGHTAFEAIKRTDGHSNL